ncbi:MAG: FAD:protein FMN transferase [Gammaproteobacteria bacterium]|nr:FAD:protein FMN transferase [Gammaproteobacteria bacterium]
MKPRWLNLLLIATLGLTACSEAPPQVHRAKLFTLGTLVDVSVLHQDEAVAQQAVTIVETELATINRQWHAWHDSPLTLINQQLAQGETVTIDSATHHFIQQAQTLATNSDQLFNPTIGSLVEQWGFHSDERPDGAPPAKERIDAALKQAPSMANITLTATTLTSNNPAVQFDFGAFGKGYAIDRAVEQLKRAGIKNAIVNAGGDLRAIGSKGGRPWRIGVRHPTEAGVIASIEIDGDESIFTSGNYERFFDFDGRRYHHIIDPRNGYPANDAISVTVIHHNAATADAAATALFIAGTTQWPQIAKQMGIDEVMLIGNDLTIYMTRKMAQRIRLEIDDAQIKIIGNET